MSPCEKQGRSSPHSTVERFSQNRLPPAVHQFLFSQSGDCFLLRLLLRAMFGAVSGAVLFLGIAHGLPLTFDTKLGVGYVFTGVCVFCGAISASFRCSVLLIFPIILGSRGRTYLMVFILSVLYSGPLLNMEKNVRGVALALSCNLDLQINNSRLLWSGAEKPVRDIMQQLLADKTSVESDTQNTGTNFQDIRDEVMSRYGYQSLSGNNTQEQYAEETEKQCDSVVGGGVKRCTDWFKKKWDTCMTTTHIRVLNHIFCVPLKFTILCDVMKVMTPWCKEHVPVEGNFGQLYDELDIAMKALSAEFSSQLVIQEQQKQSVLGGAVVDQEFTESVGRSFKKLSGVMEQVTDALQFLLSFTFITIFTSAFSYVRQYRSDIRFDNVYITTYFRQIDARRRIEGKRCVLPLRHSERKKLIDPWKFKIHQDELRQVVAGVIQLLSICLLCLVLLVIDFSLVHALDIVSRNTFSHFNLSSGHDVDISVGGNGIMSRLMKKTVDAFKSSYHMSATTDNKGCVSPPSSLSTGAYITCASCVLLVALFTCLQVYTNRLRRVISTLFHPQVLHGAEDQREKKRILFLYNLQLQRRIYCADTKHITRRGRSGNRTVRDRLTRLWRRLCCNKRRQRGQSDSETHYGPN